VKFTHALVQTVLYKQVVGKRRVLLHRRAAETLERVHAGAEKPVAGRLARHFHRGRVGASAFRYACMAGDAARRVYAHWEAEELFRIALEHSPDGEERVRLLERLGDVYDSVAYYEQGIDRYREALGGATRPETRVRLRRKILMLQRKASLAPPARLLDGVRGLIEEAADLPVERFHLLLELAIVPGSTVGTEPAEDALRLAETIGEEMLVISALERLGGLIVTRGADTRAALPYLERARVMAQRVDDPPRLMLYHTLAGIAHAKMGEFGDALAEFEGMLTIAERIGDPRSVASACINLSALMLRLGRYADAEERARHALDTLERRGGEGVTQSLFNLAECARLTGDLATATSRYRKLVEVAAAGDSWECEAVGRAGIGLCALASRNLDDARAEAERVLDSVREHEGWFEDRDLVELFLARIAEADGDSRSAIERLAAFSEPLRTLDTFLSARIEVQLLRLRLANGEEIVPELEALAERVAGIQSPPLREAVAALRADLGPLAERPAEARAAS
jgi:tetratricopeptide (TPR) repeat protein